MQIFIFTDATNDIFFIVQYPYYHCKVVLHSKVKGAITIFSFIHHNICHVNKRVNTLIIVYTFGCITKNKQKGVGGLIQLVSSSIDIGKFFKTEYMNMNELQNVLGKFVYQSDNLKKNYIRLEDNSML